MMKCQAKYIISSVSHLELSRSMHRAKESFVSPKCSSRRLFLIEGTEIDDGSIVSGRRKDQFEVVNERR